ncbi:MAG TPA: ABC transporter permease subunit, partial [Gemmataceae bacterium]|nr:ABC transporter permease subunit [Gemmataceae bacterium]
MLSSGLTPFAVLVIEREPYKLADLPGRLLEWVQNIGGFAALGLALGIVAHLSYFRHVPPRTEKPPSWQKTLFRLAVFGVFAAYGLLGVLKLPDVSRSLGSFMQQLGGEEAPSPTARGGSPPPSKFQETLVTVGGGCAIFAVLLPFAVHLARLRPRRIWALARLTFKEAIRRRVLWVFLALLLVFLFAGWFLPSKPEQQVQGYVEFVYFTMSLLLLITASLLAAFGIPAEVRSQSIHTIVTKPVERFEIVLGRFLGTMFLMTIVLLVMSLLSLLYVGREIDPDAQFESLRARIAFFGDLRFRDERGAEFKGENVGRVWEYRKYVRSGQRAIWAFHQLPTRLDERKSVPCEFGFDIFRTFKGKTESEPVACTLTFTTRNWDPSLEAAYRNERGSINPNARPNEPDWEAVDRLAEQYGYYEVPSQAVVDYHTHSIDVPVGLFKNAQREPTSSPSLRPVGSGPATGLPRAQSPPRPSGAQAVPVQVAVKCESARQFLGVAPRDLYLVDAERYFGLNFLKGALGLWFRLVLVVGVGVALSTYLSGVVSWLATMVLYLMGLAWEFIESLATYDPTSGKRASIVGGPAEAFLRLVTLQKETMPLAPTPAAKTAGFFDDVYSWTLRNVLLKIIPDVDRYSWTEYVAKGFDISA